MNSTIPLLEGYCANGEGAFLLLELYMNKKMRFLRRPVKDTGLLRIRLCHNPFHTPRIA